MISKSMEVNPEVNMTFSLSFKGSIYTITRFYAKDTFAAFAKHVEELTGVQNPKYIVKGKRIVHSVDATVGALLPANATIFLTGSTEQQYEEMEKMNEKMKKRREYTLPPMTSLTPRVSTTTYFQAFSSIQSFSDHKKGIMYNIFHSFPHSLLIVLS